MRKQLSHAFSQRSLEEQESLISRSVDLFIQRLGEDGPQGIDIVLTFTLMSFDIIGDLGFGESFGGIQSSRNDAHPLKCPPNRIRFCRGSTSLDISNDRCNDARRIGRLRYALSGVSKDRLDALQKLDRPPDCGHKDQ